MINFNVIDICLTAEQIKGDQGVMSHQIDILKLP